MAIPPDREHTSPNYFRVGVTQEQGTNPAQRNAQGSFVLSVGGTLSLVTEGQGNPNVGGDPSATVVNLTAQRFDTNLVTAQRAGQPITYQVIQPAMAEALVNTNIALTNRGDGAESSMAAVYTRPEATDVFVVSIGNTIVMKVDKLGQITPVPAYPARSRNPQARVKLGGRAQKGNPSGIYTTQAAQSPDNMAWIKVEKGEALVVATEGIYPTLSADGIAQEVTRAFAPQDAADAIMAKARTKTTDSRTVMVIANGALPRRPEVTTPISSKKITGVEIRDIIATQLLNNFSFPQLQVRGGQAEVQLTELQTGKKLVFDLPVAQRNDRRSQPDKLRNSAKIYPFDANNQVIGRMGDTIFTLTQTGSQAVMRFLQGPRASAQFTFDTNRIYKWNRAEVKSHFAHPDEAVDARISSQEQTAMFLAQDQKGNYYAVIIDLDSSNGTLVR